MPASNHYNRKNIDLAHPVSRGHNAHSPASFLKGCFSFYLQDGSTGKGLRGGLFELVSYEKSGRNMAISNQYGKVNFCVYLGVSYALAQKAAPDSYSLNPNVFSLRLENDGLFVNGAKESSFVIINYQKGHRFSVIYHENDASPESSRFSLSYGDAHKVATARQAGIQRHGHAFVSWNQSPDGKGALWLPGENLIVKNDVRLFAQWIPIPSAQTQGTNYFT